MGICHIWHGTVHNCVLLSYRRIRRYSVCRLKRLEARDLSHVRFTNYFTSTDQLINWFGCPKLIYKRKRIHLVAMLTTADFIFCVTFGKSAEFVQKYLHKGMRIVISGRISTGNYKDKERIHGSTRW